MFFKFLSQVLTYEAQTRHQRCYTHVRRGGTRRRARDAAARASCRVLPHGFLFFLDRAALVHLNKTSLLHGSLCYTWHDTYNRCRRLASSLSKHCLGSTVHAFVVVIACYSCLCLVPKKKKKGERKNYCSGVFHFALNILEMKRSNFLDIIFYFFIF